MTATALAARVPVSITTHRGVRRSTIDQPVARLASASVPVEDAVPPVPLRVSVHAAYPALRAGLTALLRAEGYEVADETGEVAPELDAPDAIDVAVVDLGGDEAPDTTTSLPTVFLAEPGTPRPAAREGVGWLPRDASAREIVAAARAVAVGLVVLHQDFMREPALRSSEHVEDAEHTSTPLTPREVEVLQLLAAGLTNKAAARALGISEHTVKFHVGAVLGKLGAHSRTEAVTAAARRGLLSL